MLRYTQINIKTLSKVLSTNVLGTFVFGLAVLFLSGCASNSLEDIDQLIVETVELPVSSSKDVVLQYSDSGVVKMVLHAPKLDRFTNNSKEPYVLMTEGVLIEFVDEQGNVEARVSSNHAIHYPQKDILILTKDVQVINLDGDKLNSEYLVWNSKTKKITSDDFVKITTADEIMYGDGMVANQDFTNYSINNIKGIISVDDEDVQ